MENTFLDKLLWTLFWKFSKVIRGYDFLAEEVRSPLLMDLHLDIERGIFLTELLRDEIDIS